MEPRIDVHLLTLNEPAEWREACIASLEDAPIQLHVLPGIPGRIGEARAAGYAQGTLPLVSFVDPDDLYEASAFTQLADALDACPRAVMAYTDEALMDETGRDIAVRRLAYSRWQHANIAAPTETMLSSSSEMPPVLPLGSRNTRASGGSAGAALAKKTETQST